MRCIYTIFILNDMINRSPDEKIIHLSACIFKCPFMYPILFIVHYCVNALCLVGSRNKTWFHFVKYINGINLFIYHTDAFYV